MARSDTAAEISTFLGINEENAEGGGVGEARMMSNFVITKDGYLKKRNGVKRLSTNALTGKALCFSDFYTQTLANYSFFVLTTTALWGYRFQTRSFAAVYTRNPGGAGALFQKGDYLYLIGGGEYIRFDRTMTYETVAPYVPTVNIGKNPTGSVFTPYEKPNLLTSFVKEEFITESGRVFIMKYKNISDVTVTSFTTVPDFTVSSAVGSITFETAFPPGAAVTVCYSTTALAGRDTEIKNAAGALFFDGEGDSDLFVWRGEDNARYYTSNGDVTYFPEDNCDTVGNGKIIDAVKCYGKMLTFTTDGIYSSGFEVSESGDVCFPTALINADCRYLSSRVVTAKNLPTFLSMSKLKRVVSTSVVGEKNVETVSGRVKALLASLTVTDIFNVSSRNELWMTAADTTLIWNYALDLFYRFDGFTAAFVFEMADGVKFIDGNGRLCVFDGGYDDVAASGTATPVNAYCYLAGIDFGSPFRIKRLCDVFLKTSKEEDSKGTASLVTGDSEGAQTADTAEGGGVARKKLIGERFCSLDLLIRCSESGKCLTVERAVIAAASVKTISRL